jgi:4-hydroxyphenylacetate 3-monooxygenase
MTRTGSEYLEGLRDGREIWLGGERIDDVTRHPAVRNAAHAYAHMYDMTHEPEFRDVLTYPSPKTGQPVSRGYEIARTYEDIVARRHAIKTFSESNYGFIGRSPDYKASMWAGFAATPEVFDQGEFKGGDNVTRHYEYLRDNDLFQGHAITNPQVNRAVHSASNLAEDFLYAGVVKERDDGIVVRGSKMIATGAMFSDEMHVSSLQPFGSADQAYAIAFSVPMATKGVKLISRRSYEEAATSVFDYPLSKRYDETDALMVFDDVFVPWERVFIYRDVELIWNHWWTTPALINMTHQFAVRQWTKLEFLMGLGVKLTKQNGIYRLPAVQERLGLLLGKVLTIKGLVLGAEANYELFESGADAVVPNREMISSFNAIGPFVYKDVIDSLRWLIGGGPIQAPASYEAFVNEEIAPTSRRYMQGAAVDGETRTKLIKAVWDAVGSEFAMRHELYERFALGPVHTTMLTFMNEARIDVYEAFVEDLLSTYDLQDAVREAAAWTPPQFPKGARPKSVRTGAAETPGTVATVSARGIKADRPNPVVMAEQRRKTVDP